MRHIFFFSLSGLLSNESRIFVSLPASTVETGHLGSKAMEGISFLLWGLILLIGLPISIYLILKIVRLVRSLREKGLIEEMRAEAEKKEQTGEFVSAGVVYEKLNDPEKAAALYEKGGDFIRAATLYESLGQVDKSAEMFEKAGDSSKAAEACMAAGRYMEAAKLYNSKGDTLKAAQALELSGNKMAAVRTYREGKDYSKASLLLKEEGMLKEAAEMFGFSLAGEDLKTSNIDRYYTYADLLEKSGDTEKAVEIYKDILRLEPDYLDIQYKLRSLSSPAPEESGPEAGSVPEAGGTDDSSKSSMQTTTLDKMMETRLEPRYCFRLWVQILKVLGEKVVQGEFPENISPENISVDPANRVTFSVSGFKNLTYTAPEVISGSKPDQVSLIYSMGLILYEMLAGSLDSAGIKNPGEVMDDVPSWLDDLTIRCIRKDREERYQSIEEIFSTLKTLKTR